MTELDRYVDLLNESFWLSVILIIVCLIVIYSMETRKIAFSHRHGWEKKSWAKTRPASRLYANYLDFFNRLVYRSPAIMAWRLKQQFLKTLEASRGISIQPDEKEFAFIKSPALKEFLQNPSRWSKENIRSVVPTMTGSEGQLYRRAYQASIGSIAGPFNGIINTMRQEFDLETVEWESVPYKALSWKIRLLYYYVLKFGIALIVAVLAAMVTDRYFFGESTKDPLLILVITVLTFAAAYRFLSDRVYQAIITANSKFWNRLARK